MIHVWVRHMERTPIRNPLQIKTLILEIGEIVGKHEPDDASNSLSERISRRFAVPSS